MRFIFPWMDVSKNHNCIYCHVAFMAFVLSLPCTLTYEFISPTTFIESLSSMSMSMCIYCFMPFAFSLFHLEIIWCLLRFRCFIFQWISLWKSSMSIRIYYYFYLLCLICFSFPWMNVSWAVWIGWQRSCRTYEKIKELPPKVLCVCWAFTSILSRELL